MLSPSRGEQSILIRIGLWAAFGVVIVWQLWSVIFTTSSPNAASGIFGDEAVVTQAAVRIVNGQFPHRDFYSFTIGSAYYPLAVWMKIFGQDFSSVQWFNLISTVFLITAITWLSMAFSRWVGILTGLVFAFIIFPNWPFVSYHWQFLLFAVISTRLLVSRLTGLRLMLAGLALAGAGLTLPNKAIFFGIVQIIFILFVLQKGRRLRGIIIFLSGPIIIGGLIIALLLINQLWDPVWTQVVTNNITFYPTLVNKSIFGLNGFSYIMIFFSAILGLPLIRKSFLRHEWRKIYTLLFISHIALIVSILYHSEWIHFLQIGIFFLILFFAASIDRLKSSWRLFKLENTKGLIKSLFLLIPILGVGLWWLNNMIISVPKKNLVPFETPRGRVYVDFVRNPTGQMTNNLEIIDHLLSTTLVGKRVFFYPYLPGYYYFYKKTNPTSYDVLPSSQPPEKDKEKLKQELLANADVLVFIQSSWSTFNAKSELMDWMRKNFPQSASFLNGRIQLYSKNPIQLSQ